MGILGIRNRSENWKTARSFAPFFRNDYASTLLAKQLLQPFGRDSEVQMGTVKIELFWKGVRDYLKREDLKTREKASEFRQAYSNRFGTLRDEISKFDGFNELQDHNYDASMIYETRISDKLSDILRDTEIDIVLETPERIFVGEARHESGLGTNGNSILVHQLIKEYVTVSILVDLTHSYKQVVPFVIADREKLASIKRTDQVNFMCKKGWLNKKNILSWDCIKKIAES